VNEWIWRISVHFFKTAETHHKCTHSLKVWTLKNTVSKKSYTDEAFLFWRIGTGFDRASLWQPARGPVANQASLADPASLQGDGHWVHGSLLPSGACLWRRALGKDNRRVSGPVFVVRGRQEAPFPCLDKTGRFGAPPAAYLQMVSGHQ